MHLFHLKAILPPQARTEAGILLSTWANMRGELQEDINHRGWRETLQASWHKYIDSVHPPGLEETEAQIDPANLKRTVVADPKGD